VTRILSADWVLPIEGPPIRDGAIVLEEGRIAAVGTAADLGEGEAHAGSAILPGFVNAHTHLEYAVYAGFGDGLADFSEWITMHIARKGRIGWEDFVAIARLGAAESLASGVTTVGDCSYSGASAIACAELGLRATIYLEVFGSDPGAALARFARNRERAEPAFSERVRPGISPHAPYSTGLETYRACIELGLPVATHISESPSEVVYLRHGTGPWAAYPQLIPSPGTTGTHLLAGAGLLSPHCTMVEPDEIELLAEHGVGVAHCPRSNAALGCGVAPLAELRSAGVNVGVGTDSPASAPSFDFFEELRSVVLSARAREQRADALTAAEALELATLGSARALGLDAEIGSLVPGKRADVTVVSLADSAYVPWEDPANAVVFGGSPDRVVATLVDGESQYVRGGFEWHELRQRADSARSRMLHAAGEPVAEPA
jgi:cytosine/adenosine deaminase-related metal-dependent hydrolase